MIHVTSTAHCAEKIVSARLCAGSTSAERVGQGEVDGVTCRVTCNMVAARLGLVSRGHTPFRKRGKGSGNFCYSSLLPRTVECVPITAQYSVT